MPLASKAGPFGRARTWAVAALAATALGAAALTFTPSVTAETSPPATLRSLQQERVALANALTPSVVALAPERPKFGADQQAGDAQACSGFVVDGEYVVTDIEAGPLRTANPDNPYMNAGDKLWMMAHDGTEFEGTVVGVDRRNLLLLARMGSGHPALPSVALGNSDEMAMGSTAVGLGNCLDSLLVDGRISFSYGTISGFYRFEPLDVMEPDNTESGGDPYKGNVLEIDVAVHDGDHGGPVFNLKGEVIGMSCSHFMAGRHLACAVPSNQIRAVLPQLKKGIAQDELAQAWLGFKAKSTKDGRILISEVDANGPAAKAGIATGWELVRVDNYRIPNFDRLREMLGVGYIVRKRKIGGGMMGRAREVTIPVSYGVPVGTHIQLTLRDAATGKEKTVDLITGEKAEDF
ncbi:MAG: serine protease [Planctomycetes bacterium]|nr:serine protease [Planctomycetota bacterium]